MDRLFAIGTGIVALLLASVGPAVAFQEIPAAPAPDSAPATPQAVPPAMQLGTPGSPGEKPVDDETGVFGFGLLPKLDFGLELLYGEQGQQPLQLQPGETLEENGDVTVLGKVKRRF